MTPYRHNVQYYETDKMGITHHANYIHWMEEARIAFLDELGYSYDKLEAMGVGSPVMSVECRYKTSTTFPDEVTVTVRVERSNGVRLRLGYEIRKADGTLACEAHSEHCFVSPEGKLLRLQNVCPGLYAALAALVEAE